ncbi:MAG: hypothetical protein KDC98_14925 [Planctomycetes bacterium]|nr:hypothetical protein [Planctomycetota bacterium]
MAFSVRPRPAVPALLSWLLSLAGVAAPVNAQCGSHWLAGDLPGADSHVLALASWDPDGLGPLAPRLVAGGRFATVSESGGRFVAWRDATRQWHPFGAELQGDEVSALLPMPNGDLIVGGRFQCPSVPGTFNIARWDGSAWRHLAGGMAGGVRDLALAPNGDVIAVGAFTTAGGVAANGVARWNGASWAALGSGITGARTVVVMPNGDVIVGGTFANAGGVAAASIARWDGQSWSPLGSGITAGSTPTPGNVADLVVRANGDLVAGGRFSAAGGVAARHAAVWNG